MFDGKCTRCYVGTTSKYTWSAWVKEYKGKVYLWFFEPVEQLIFFYMFFLKHISTLLQSEMFLKMPFTIGNWCKLFKTKDAKEHRTVVVKEYRPSSRCGHLDFTPAFNLTVTKLRLDEIIVWCHAKWMFAFIAVTGNRE